MGKGAAHVIVLVASGRYQLLKLGHDALIAAVACIVHPQPVMNLLAAIKRQHHIAHFTVGEVDHVIIDEHTVCGQRKAEIFAPLLSTLRAYSTSCFTTSQFISGSPPKKSTSRLVRLPE